MVVNYPISKNVFENLKNYIGSKVSVTYVAIGKKFVYTGILKGVRNFEEITLETIQNGKPEEIKLSFIGEKLAISSIMLIDNDMIKLYSNPNVPNDYGVSKSNKKEDGTKERLPYTVRFLDLRRLSFPHNMALKRLTVDIKNVDFLTSKIYRRLVDKNSRLVNGNAEDTYFVFPCDYVYRCLRTLINSKDNVYKFTTSLTEEEIFNQIYEYLNANTKCFVRQVLPENENTIIVRLIKTVEQSMTYESVSPIIATRINRVVRDIHSHKKWNRVRRKRGDNNVNIG